MNSRLSLCQSCGFSFRYEESYLQPKPSLCEECRFEKLQQSSGRFSELFRLYYSSRS